MSSRMDPIGQKKAVSAAGGIDPQRGAGESGVTES